MNGLCERILERQHQANTLLREIRELYGQVNGEAMPEIDRDLRSAAALVDDARRRLITAQAHFHRITSAWRDQR